MQPRQPAARQRGIRLANSTGVPAEGLTCSAVSPRVTEWVPQLLEALVPHTEARIRQHTSGTEPSRVSARLLARLLSGWTELDDPWDDATAEAAAYIRAITTRALTYNDATVEDLSSYHQRRHAELTATVTSIGTGRGPLNASLGALAKGPVAIHRALDTHPQVLTLQLDGEAWTNLDDRRTGVRALAAIAVLAEGFDVRLVASPTLQRHLAKRYPAWTNAHLDLTVSRDRSLQDDTSAHHSQPTGTAWDAVRDLDTAPAKRRLLGALTRTDARGYDALAADDTINIAAGSVSRYVLDLERRGLVAIDRRGQQHTVRLTEMGQRAVSRCLDAEYNLVYPTQRRLDGRLTATPQPDTSAVSSQSQPMTPREEPTVPLDARVAATGDPDAHAEYVQWLTTPDPTPDILNRRFATVAREDAVTLVDEQVSRFEDGRVAYLSHTGMETLVILQWGGPLATLGRLAGVLLSEKALAEILTPDRVGAEFEKLDDNDAYGYDIGRLLRRGRQVGWCADTECTYETWRDRITAVRDNLLARVANLTGSDDTAARSELFEDLHGFVASATQLYHAAGIDLTTTLRVPDTAALARSTTRLQDLCEFLIKTVPKQSVYGIHSGYRLLFEDRPPKLRRRLPYEIEPNSQLDLTMAWVIAGPTATGLQDAITTVLSEELTTIREAIAEGTEAAPTLKIPVVDGTTYPAIRRVIDEIATAHDVQWSPRRKHRLVRLCLRAFGPSETTQQACPYDVVVSLLRALSETRTPTPADVECAAATLPATRFRPDLTPTATKLYATLLRADGPLGRTALIEQAGISASSYGRRLEAVQALDRVQAVQVISDEFLSNFHCFSKVGKVCLPALGKMVRLGLNRSSFESIIERGVVLRCFSICSELNKSPGYCERCRVRSRFTYVNTSLSGVYLTARRENQSPSASSR